jgi:hypothetical protein
VCTLILGLGMPQNGVLVLGANRDESPERPSAGPAPLTQDSRVVGGRDLVSGGTWLAVRDRRFVAALLNRRPAPGDDRDPSSFRSRGLLCLDLASSRDIGTTSVDPGTGEGYSPWLDRALRLLRAATYARCTLVWAGADGIGWTIQAGDLPTPKVTRMECGWHAITHRDLDDPSEPRTRWLLEQLRATNPAGVDEALEIVRRLLRGHGESGAPPVCLHGERFPTVSSTLLALNERGPARYLHAPGPPCVTPYEDHSALLEPRARAPLAPGENP